jgi:hypothetical protein
VKRHEVIDLITALKTLDPRGFVTIDNTIIQVWESVMNREPMIAGPDAMRTAYELVSQPDATFPTPGAFRAMVAETVSNLPSVGDARRQVERALRQNYPGMPAKYRPDDVVLKALRQIGGASMFRASQSEFDTARLWKEFDAAYRAIRDERVSPRDISTDPALPATHHKAIGEKAS